VARLKSFVAVLSFWMQRLISRGGNELLAIWRPSSITGRFHLLLGQISCCVEVDFTGSRVYVHTGGHYSGIRVCFPPSLRGKP
jgi:hypothetical protein